MRIDILFITAIVLCCGAGPVTAAEGEGAVPEAAQAAMAKMSTTGAEHEALARMVGEWQVASTMWMGPGAEPQTSKGTASISPVLGGKWFQQHYHGEMMGQPYHGIGLSGYDTFHEHHVAIWCDDFSTGMHQMKGSSPDGGTTVTYTAHLDHCPMTGGPIDFRHVQVQESADRFVYTMYQTPAGGQEFKAMELVYTRAE